MSEPGVLRLWCVDMWDGDRYVVIAHTAGEALSELEDEWEIYAGNDDPGHDAPYPLRDGSLFTLSMVDGWDSDEEPDEWRAAGFTVDEEKRDVTGTCRQFADYFNRTCTLSSPAY